MKEQAIWGIHAGQTGDADSLFIEKKCIAIGWEKLGDMSSLKTREDFKAKYAEVYQDPVPQSVATKASQPYRFMHEMKIGDLVIYPSKITREIHIGRIKGEYQYKPQMSTGYPNQRAVDWLKKFPRTRFTQGALYEIGSALSLFQVKNYADEFKSALEGVQVVPPGADTSVSEVSEDIEQQTSDFILKQLSANLKGLPLEEFVAHLLEQMGYKTRLCRTNQPSVDIIAHKDELGFEPPIIKVQVKSGDGKVTDKDVSALYGKVESKEFALMVTLGQYTPHAQSFADSRSNLRLIDGTELVNLIYQYYEQFDSRYKGILPLKRVYIPQSIE